LFNIFVIEATFEKKIKKKSMLDFLDNFVYNGTVKEHEFLCEKISNEGKFYAYK